jgi:hypothetical protein
MSEASSPMYDQGRADAEADDAAIGTCPPGVPLGPRPPYPAYPVMYLRGYEDTYIGVPHQCSSRCREDDE